MTTIQAFFSQSTTFNEVLLLLLGWAVTYLKFLSNSLLNSHSITLFQSKFRARSNTAYLPMSSTQTPFDVRQLKVAILVTTSSSASISTGSPSLPILESSLHDPRSWSPGTPTVKFAPLPQIDPTRKRSLAPLGVPGRSRRMPAIQKEGGSLLWSIDPDMPEEQMEDPIISFAKLVKKTGIALWRRVRKGSKAVVQENMAFSAEPVLDIRSMGDVPGHEGSRRRRASWSPLAERRTLGWGMVQRKSTSDLPHVSVSMVL